MIDQTSPALALTSVVQPARVNCNGTSSNTGSECFTGQSMLDVNASNASNSYIYFSYKAKRYTELIMYKSGRIICPQDKAMKNHVCKKI